MNMSIAYLEVEKFCGQIFPEYPQFDTDDCSTAQPRSEVNVKVGIISVSRNCLRRCVRCSPLPLSAANSENPKILWWRRWGLGEVTDQAGPEDSELGWSEAGRWLTRSIYLTMAPLLPLPSCHPGHRPPHPQGCCKKELWWMSGQMENTIQQ